MIVMIAAAATTTTMYYSYNYYCSIRFRLLSSAIQKSGNPLVVPNSDDLFDMIERNDKLVTRKGAIVAAQSFSSHCDVIQLDLPGASTVSGHYPWRKDLGADYQKGINDALIKLIGYGDRVR